MGFFYYNTAGQRLYAAEPPLEPPDVWGEEEEGEEEEDDTQDWVYDDEHSYVLRGGKVIQYD